MSIRLMTQVWDSSPHNGATLLVLLAIADHANDNGICWPSIERLAQKARISKRQTQRIIAKLEAEGAIEVDRDRGRGHTSLYKLKGDIDVKPVKEKVTSAPLKGDICDIKGDTIVSPKPSIEPSIEPPSLAADAAPPAHQHPNVVAYRNLTERFPTKAQMKILAKDDMPLAQFEPALQSWLGHGYNPTNIAGMLDYARHPERWSENKHSNENKPAARTAYGAGVTLNSFDSFEKKVRNLYGPFDITEEAVRSIPSNSHSGGNHSRLLGTS